MTQAGTHPASSAKNRLFPFALVALIALFALVRCGMGGGVAPVPAGFDKAVTIASATSASTSDGKPVLMMVTADWCGPCQTLKRDALADPRVVEAMKSRTHSVYVDATKSTPAEVAPFSIEGFPTLLMVKDGKEVGRLVGVKPADAVLAWINSNS